jgi:hypothetical protein
VVIHHHLYLRIDFRPKCLGIEFKVMVRIENCRFDGVGRPYKLCVRHGVGKIFGEKCNVDLFESFHKGNELGISCEIDLKTA